MVLSTVSRSSSFGYSGSCKAFFDFQLSGLHRPGAAVDGGDGIGVVATGVLDGWAAWTPEMGWRDFLGRREKVGWWVWEEGKGGWDCRRGLGESDVVFDRAIVGFVREREMWRQGLGVEKSY